MHERDVELIESLAARHDELRRLWQEHRRLEQELEVLRQQRFLTPAEEVRQREIQKAKLVGRDRIEAILREHRAP